MGSQRPDLPSLTWSDIHQALLFLAITPEEKRLALHFVRDLEGRVPGLSGVQLMTEVAATAGLIVRAGPATGLHPEAGSQGSPLLLS